MEKIRLGDACEILNGFAFKSENYVDSGIRVIRIANVQKGYIEDNTPAFYPLDSVELDKYMLEEGDLLISLTGNVGRVAILEKEFLPAALNQRVACLRLKTSRLTKGYLFHILNGNLFEQQCIQSSKGVAQKNMSTEWLKNYEIPLYSKEKQDVITEILDKTYNVISCRQQEIQKLDDLIKARFIELFVETDEASEWSYHTIADVSNDMRTGPFGSALHHDEFVDSGVFVLGIDNAVENKFSYNRMRYITEEKYQQLKRYTVYPGDVIITIMGTVGCSAVIPADMPKAINTKHLACITPNVEMVNAQFLSCAFQIHPDIRTQLKKQCKGAIMAGLNLTIIKGLSFRIPPINLQNQFVEFYEQTDKSKFQKYNATILSHNIYMYSKPEGGSYANQL